MDEFEVPHVHLRDVWTERTLKPRFTKDFGKVGTRWWAAVTLNLYDTDRKQDVSEWFYLIVCSPEFVEKPLKNIPLEMKFTIVQSGFDLQAVKDEATKRFSKVHPQNWDEFYSQMEQYFLYEP